MPPAPAHNGTYAAWVAGGQNGLVKFSTGVGRLESVAEDLSSWRSLEDFPISEAYVCGELLDGPETLEVVSVVFVTDLPVADLAWRVRPPVVIAWEAKLGLNKVPVERLWRPDGWPVWNHYIARAVRFWSRSGEADEAVLDSLGRRRFDDLPFVVPASRERLVAQVRVERSAARHHLNDVLDRYHDRDWRSDHKLYGFYPEDHLWWAAEAFRELDEALRDGLTDSE